MTECYMCNENNGLTKEHAPPKCIFPKSKDTDNGQNLRVELTTVPSCVEHNGKKSKDDEYLLYVLVMNVIINEIGTTQFQNKLLKIIKERPYLMQEFLKTKINITIEDIKTGIKRNTFAFQVDLNRFDSSIDMMTRALFYDHYGKRKWLKNVVIHSDFMMSLDSNDSKEINNKIAKDIELSDKLFSGIEFHGKNQDAFKYQILKLSNNSYWMKFHFYSDVKVTVKLNDY